MSKPNKYFDFALLGIFSLLIAISFWHHFTVGVIIYLNNLLAATLLIIGIILKISKTNTSRFVVIILLLVSTFGLINFVGGAVARVGVGNSNNDNFAFFQAPGIDPIILLISIVYCVINRSFFFECYSLVFHGSSEEQEKETKTKTHFYYEKFNVCSEEELSGFFKMYQDYPPEAQIALRKIHQEKKLSLMVFE